MDIDTQSQKNRVKKGFYKGCNNCNKQYYVYPSEEKNRGRIRKYCCKRCLGESNKGKTAWNKGKPLTKEHRKSLEKYWQSLKGRDCPMKNKRHSEAALKKISVKSKEMWRNKEFREQKKEMWRDKIPFSDIEILSLFNKEKLCITEICKKLRMNTPRVKNILKSCGISEEQIKQRTKEIQSIRARKRWDNLEYKDFHLKRMKKLWGAFSGEKNHFWKGGISFEPYGLAWTKQLKESIRQRDNHVCQLCNKHQSQLKTKLSVHHIDYVKTNIFTFNLISLCVNCHMITNNNRTHWTTFFRNYLNEKYGYNYTTQQKTLVNEVKDEYE